MLLLRNLDIDCDEEGVYWAVAAVGGATPRRALLAYDDQSRESLGFAFVEYANVQVSVEKRDLAPGRAGLRLTLGRLRLPPLRGSATRWSSRLASRSKSSQLP